MRDTQQHNFGSLIAKMPMHKAKYKKPKRKYNEHLMYIGRGKKMKKKNIDNILKIFIV